MVRFESVGRQLEALNSALFIESNPIPVKWALAQLGLITGEMRLPLTSLDDEYKSTVLLALRSIKGAEAA